MTASKRDDAQQQQHPENYWDMIQQHTASQRDPGVPEDEEAPAATPAAATTPTNRLTILDDHLVIGHWEPVIAAGVENTEEEEEEEPSEADQLCFSCADRVCDASSEAGSVDRGTDHWAHQESGVDWTSLCFCDPSPERSR